MSVGIKVDRTVLDQRAGNIAVKLRDACEDARSLKVWLDGVDDATLIDLAGDFKYTQGEVTQLRSAYIAAATLADIAFGQTANPSTFPYLNTLKPLTGVQ